MTNCSYRVNSSLCDLLKSADRNMEGDIEYIYRFCIVGPLYYFASCNLQKPYNIGYLLCLEHVRNTLATRVMEKVRLVHFVLHV